MSPPPLSTATLNFQGGGSCAAAAERLRWRRPDREARKPLGLALVDSERGRVPQEREDGGLAAGEAVQASFLEPLDLVRPEAGALRCLVDRQLALQAEAGERRARLGREGFPRLWFAPRCDFTGGNGASWRFQ